MMHFACACGGLIEGFLFLGFALISWITGPWVTKRAFFRLPWSRPRSCKINHKHCEDQK